MLKSGPQDQYHNITMDLLEGLSTKEKIESYTKRTFFLGCSCPMLFWAFLALDVLFSFALNMLITSH